MREGFDIPRKDLDAIIAVVKRYGADVEEIWEEPEGGRFIGTFEGRTIKLFPKYDRNFALYFTVAHLYGHMVQLTRMTPEMERSISFVTKVGQKLAAADVQCIYDYELEAAAIGRTLMAQVGSISPELDAQYSRMFFADFHYLVNFIETGEAGVDLFEKYLRREPTPWRRIDPDARPLVDLAGHVAAGSAVVV
jgi:hypothetical protein